MRFAARVHNSEGEHRAEVSAGSHQASLSIAARPSGFGSSVSGAELLMLALATCYCNDVYREASRTGIQVTEVEVECAADFAAEGASASDVVFTARISANADEELIRELAARADSLAEIQNTVRAAVPVRLGAIEATRV